MHVWQFGILVRKSLLAIGWFCNFNSTVATVYPCISPVTSRMGVLFFCNQYRKCYTRCHRFRYYHRNAVLGSKGIWTKLLCTPGVEMFITIFCLRSWGCWMVKNWQWLVRFYHLSWPTKGLMSYYCKHCFAVPITSHLIDRLKSHAWRVAEVSKSKGGRVHGYVSWVDDLSVVSHYNDRYTETHHSYVLLKPARDLATGKRSDAPCQ